eukprot:5905611-Amphidinium_carterae.3
MVICLCILVGSGKCGNLCAPSNGQPAKGRLGICKPLEGPPSWPISSHPASLRNRCLTLWYVKTSLLTEGPHPCVRTRKRP